MALDLTLKVPSYSWHLQLMPWIYQCVSARFNLGAKIRIKFGWKFPFHPGTKDLLHSWHHQLRIEGPDRTSGLFEQRDSGRRSPFGPDSGASHPPPAPKSSGLLVPTCSRQKPSTSSLMGWGPGCHGIVEGSNMERVQTAKMGSLVTKLVLHGLSLIGC